MNTRRIITAIALILIITVTVVCIISGIGTASEPQETTAAPTEETLPSSDARRIYADAAQAAASMTDQTVSCVIRQQMSVGDEAYCLDSNRIMRATAMGTDGLSVLVNETAAIGEHTVSCAEAFSDGTAYIAIDENQFFCEMSADDFWRRQIPAVILDEKQYSQVTAAKNEENTVITFSGASSAERWAMPDNAQFISAEGTVTLDTSLLLTESTYHIRYQLGDVQIEKDVRVGLSSIVPDFTVPARETAQPISDPDAVRALEYACGYLMQSTQINANITEAILCEAYGDQRVQNTAIQMLAEGTNCTANVDIITTLTNSSKADSATQKVQNIHYQDSQYTLTVNGGEPAHQSGVTPLMMKTYCHDYFLSTMILPQYISGATVTDTGSTYRYDFTANDNFAHLLCQNASQILYQDPALLLNLSDSYAVETVNAYLIVDKVTGLPTASGISCIAIYSVEGFPYRLQYQTEQTYTIGS